MKKLMMLLLVVAVVVSLVFTGCAPKGKPAEPEPIPATWVIQTTPAVPFATVEQAGQEQLYGMTTGTLPDDTFDGLMVKPDGTSYKFAYLAAALECEFMTFANGIGESYARRAGGEMIVLDAKGQAVKHVENIEACIAMGDIDAILSEGTDPAAVVPALGRASDAGIACFGLFNEAYSDRLVSSSIRDWSKQGEMGGEKFKELVDARGEPVTVYEIWGILGNPAAMGKDMGFRTVCENHPLITIVEGPECCWMPAMATDAIVSVFSTHPEWTAVFDMGSMTGGVIPGLSTIGRLYPVGHPEHVTIVALDGAATTLEAMKDGYVDIVAGNSPWEPMEVCLMSAIKYVCLGKTVERYYFNTFFYITPENCNEEYLWGNCIGKVDYDDLPILDVSNIIEFP